LGTWIAGPGPLPYGVFASPGEPARVGVAVGPYVLDLSRLYVPFAGDFALPSLNSFMARGRAAWTAVRERLVELLTEERHRPMVELHLVPLASVELRLPFEVADYVDFYASEHHASNVGRIFRPDGEPLTPNWKHLPIAYHGRAGTVVVSGTPIVRPSGQRRPPGQADPTFGPSQRLDIEAELGFVVGVGSTLGTPVAITDFAEHVFGVVLVNDWSARDIQAWEYQPLGPFLGKSFATSVSAWVTPLALLDGAWTEAPPQDPPPLGYLAGGRDRALDLDLEVELNGSVVSRTTARQLYWTMPQQLAHATSNGASVRTGDLMASGTISGAARGSEGSLIELTRNGTERLRLADGSERAFLEDGDEVVLRGRAANGVELGEVRGRVVAAAR
jgi:fumarylacetoacetase